VNPARPGGLRISPFLLVFLYYRHRDRKPQATGHYAELPRGHGALPLFKRDVRGRALLDISRLPSLSPRSFSDQVLDDSTDETQDICLRKIRAHEGATIPILDIEYVRRTDRADSRRCSRERVAYSQGRVGASSSTPTSTQARHPGADGAPFVRPNVAVVQCRWEHINRDFSALNRGAGPMLNGCTLVI